MSRDPRDTLIDELELSSNSAAWIRSLGVTTIGELLAMPTLAPPHAMIEEELGAHIEDLGLTYEGEIVDP